MKETFHEQSPFHASAPPGRSEGHPRMIAVEGKIVSVDRLGNKVTLEDGTQLTIPASVKVRRDALKEGVAVNATCEEKGLDKVVTSIQVWSERVRKAENLDRTT